MNFARALRTSACGLLAGTALCLAGTLSVHAANMSKDEAEAIFHDTYDIRAYAGTSGEQDYEGKPQNVLRAALFGAYKSLMARAEAQEEGKKPLPDSAPVISAGGLSVGMDQFALASDKPDFFKGRPEQCTAFISRKAAEVASLHYTGRVLEKHMNLPSGDDMFGAVLDDKGYCVDIDGLGDYFEEPVLEKVEPKGSGFVLSGVIKASEEEENPVDKNFKLVLTPGDKPGTWRRQYTETPRK